MQHGSPIFPVPVPVSSPVLLTPAQTPAESYPKRYQAGYHTPSTVAGTRRRGRSAPLGALRFPLVILSRLVSAFGVVGLDKPRCLQTLKNLVDVVVDLGDLQVLQRLGRHPAPVGRVGEPGDQGFADNVEPDVALAQYLEEALTEPLVQLRQRVEVVAQLIRFAANLDRHITPMTICHSIPPSNDGGAAPLPPRLSPRQAPAHQWA